MKLEVKTTKWVEIGLTWNKQYIYEENNIALQKHTRMKLFPMTLKWRLIISQAWKPMIVVPVLRRLWLEDWGFNASLDYTVSKQQSKTKQSNQTTTEKAKQRRFINVNMYTVPMYSNPSQQNLPPIFSCLFDQQKFSPEFRWKRKRMR